MTRALLLILLTTSVNAQDWPQWGRTPQHDGATAAAANRFDRIEAQVVVDPFTEEEKQEVGGVLFVHYPVPLVDGDDLYLLEKGGVFTSRKTTETQTWNVKNVRRSAAGFTTRWLFHSDWLPVPRLDGIGPQWEPVFHPALSGEVLWVPGAGGTMLKVRRTDGTLMARVNPFGVTVNGSIFSAGPPAVDAAGNIFYTAIQFTPAVWNADPLGSWLVRIAADGTTSIATFASLTPNAPAADAQCTTVFAQSQLPFPPSPNAVAPTARCGPQRPGVNATPAIAPDGTIYVVSRANFNDRYSFLIAVNPDLTRKWSASMRNHLLDGCNVGLPPNGAPGGCRAGAITGVDPTDNLPGSGRVSDDGTSSPVVLPDGNVVYGAYTSYNYRQGHLMKFSAAGAFLASYGFGWDITPAIWRHGETYSIVMKENHYNSGSYCNSAVNCPSRNSSAPNDPEQYFITQLSPSLEREWQFKSTETQACERIGPTIRCVTQSSHGFEWCVNAVAVDGNGVVYANSEDGYLYAIDQGGTQRQRIFLEEALGAAYTPLSIGNDGRIYTQNNGTVFVVGNIVRRRAVGK
jgi:outer membrane protein assembly factor BamB